MSLESTNGYFLLRKHIHRDFNVSQIVHLLWFSFPLYVNDGQVYWDVVKFLVTITLNNEGKWNIFPGTLTVWSSEVKQCLRACSSLGAKQLQVEWIAHLDCSESNSAKKCCYTFILDREGKNIVSI